MAFHPGLLGMAKLALRGKSAACRRAPVHGMHEWAGVESADPPQGRSENNSQALNPILEPLNQLRAFAPRYVHARIDRVIDEVGNSGAGN